MESVGSSVTDDPNDVSSASSGKMHLPSCSVPLLTNGVMSRACYICLSACMFGQRPLTTASCPAPIVTTAALGGVGRKCCLRRSHGE